jgi:5,10-methylenetetrahydromethanopterin reductase
MFQLAGEMADGVITYAGTTSESLDTMWKNLEVGASRVGRDVGKIRVVNGLFCYIGDDWRRAQKLAQPHAARHAMRHPDLAAAFGVEPPDTDYAEVLYPDLVHADDWERAIEVTEWVPPDYLEWFCANYCLIGTKDQVAAQVEKMRHYGIAELYVHGFYSYKMPEEALERFAADVIPNFRRNTQLLSPGLNSRAVSQPPGSLNATGVGE